jgi:hypothetical protein
MRLRNRKNDDIIFQVCFAENANKTKQQTQRTFIAFILQCHKIHINCQMLLKKAETSVFSCFPRPPLSSRITPFVASYASFDTLGSFLGSFLFIQLFEK